MAKYAKGDHVSGAIIAIHEQDIAYKSHRRHASKDAPQYEIKSDETDHIAAHKEDTIKKIV